MVKRARLADDVVGAVIGVAVKNKEDFEGALVLVVPCRDVGSCGTSQRRWFLWHLEEEFVLVVPCRDVGSVVLPRDTGSCGTLRVVVAAL